MRPMARGGANCSNVLAGFQQKTVIKSRNRDAINSTMKLSIMVRQYEECSNTTVLFVALLTSMGLVRKLDIIIS